MVNTIPSHVEPGQQVRRAGLALLALFVGSGCSALIYEIVWFQLLQLVIGSSAISLGVLLGSYMGGMCLGSLLFARLVSPRYHPLRVYAVLELGIAVCGIALLFIVPRVGVFYSASVGHGLSSVLLRAAACVVCLLPPTMLMGATLPAIARWLESSVEGMARLGFFYGANIAGAVFGCLLAGFYLLRVHDLATASYVAVAVNVSVAIISYLLAVGLPHRALAAVAAPSEMARSPVARTATRHGNRLAIYLTIALSGMSALGAEVIWTRQLSLMLGASVYTFSIILAVFLTGLGIGSSLAAGLTRTHANPHLALAWCQGLLVLAVTWAAYCVGRSLPYWPVDPSLASSPWINFQLDLLRCLWTMLPAACLWGASFPLALAAATATVGHDELDPGRLVGRVYAANTIGAILGAVGFSLIGIGFWGTTIAQQGVVGICLVAFLLMMLPAMMENQQLRWSRMASAIGGMLLTFACVQSIPEAPAGLVGYGRFLPTYQELPDFLYVAEGMNASIAVSEYPDDGTRNFHVSGKVVASSEEFDMRLQKMLGHIPALLHPQPESVLIVGCGAGVTSGTFVLHPGIKRIVICEIEPRIPDAAGKYFGEENNHVIDDPRVEIIHDDARHYIMTTQETFDIITSDPIHPWVKGAAALYSKQYYEYCIQRLKPGGIVTQWVPLYESNEAAVKSELATFFNVFPHGTVWGNDVGGEGYDVVMLGQTAPLKVNFQQLQDRLDQSDHRDVKSSLEAIDLGTALSLMAKYAGNRSSMDAWLSDAELNHDGSLRLQYLAGMSLNSYQSAGIYRAMTRQRVYPSEIMFAPPQQETALKLLLDQQ